MRIPVRPPVGHLRLVAVATLSLLLVGPALGAPVGAQGAPDGAWVVVDPPSPLRIRLRPGGAAIATVTLRNDATLALTPAVEMLSPAGDGVRASIASPDPLPAVPAGGVVQLGVALTADPSVDPGSWRGVLVLGATDPTVTPTTMVVEGRGGPAPFSGAWLEPVGLTVTADRFWPSIVPFDCDCWAYWLSAPAAAPRYPVTVHLARGGPLPGLVDTTLSSDTGGRLAVALQGFERVDGSVAAEVRLGAVDRAGLYRGPLPLDPTDETAPVLALTVRVQDLFVWPLLVALLGVLLAVSATRRRAGPTRPSAARDLAVAREAWAAGGSAISERERAWYGMLLSGDPPTAEADPGPGIEDPAALLAARPALLEAATRLEAQLRDLRPIDPDAAAFGRADALVAPATQPLRSAVDARATLDALNDQFVALALVRTAADYRDRGMRLWALLPRELRAELADDDPLAAWVAVVRPLATRAELEEAHVVQALARRNEAILEGVRTREPAARDAGSRGPEDPRLAALVRNAEFLTVWQERVPPAELEAETSRLAGAVAWPAPTEAPSRSDRPSAADLTISGGVAVATAFALLYAGGEFGSAWDYLGALAIGFAGTLLMAWAVLPAIGARWRSASPPAG